MNIVAVLGAPDPEMQAIERLLNQAGVPYVHATHGARVRAGAAYVPAAHGAGVHAGVAYRADGLTGELLDGAEVWAVECDGPAIDALREAGHKVVTVDHHRPGDPGYGRPPSEFLAASSVGQVMRHLYQAGLGPMPCGCGCQMKASQCSSQMGYVAGLQLLLVAAADHCLGAAYRGECPGVDPDALMRWRAESRAKFQNRKVEGVLADVEAAQAALIDACNIELSSGVVAADMRRPEPIRELPEAAMRMDVGYISGPLIGPDGRHKYTCSGRPEVVRAFMQELAPANGLVDVYGDPARGFAGGYLD